MAVCWAPLQIRLAKPQEVSLNLGVLSDDTDFREWSDEVCLQSPELSAALHGSVTSRSSFDA